MRSFSPPAWGFSLLQPIVGWIDLFDESTGEILEGPADIARRNG
jgi:hypothetical protein